MKKNQILIVSLILFAVSINHPTFIHEQKQQQYEVVFKVALTGLLFGKAFEMFALACKNPYQHQKTVILKNEKRKRKRLYISHKNENKFS